MKQYAVTGMTCAACSSRVEKAVSKVAGVSSCSVSLLTNSMGVEGAAKPEDVINAVRKAGYGASLKTGAVRKSPKAIEEEEMLADKETPVLKQRLIWSLGFLTVLMYFSMGHMMWGFPVPLFIQNNHIAMGLLQLLLTAAIMVINQKFFVSGFKSLFHKSPNMDTLVALGSTAAFAYSTYALFAMTGAQLADDSEAVMRYMHEFYFESAAMILTLITVGKMLEARSKGKTTDALKGLMRISPKTAVVVRDGGEATVAIDEVAKGDVFVVRPGESIPVDGIVLEGTSAVDEAALTGESIPVDKAAGDKVSAATINRSGFIKCEAVRVGEDTTLSRIIKMVSDAAATKAPIAKTADKVSGVFVPTVIIIAIATTAVWLLAGEGVGFALARGISVLVISCPCALGLATPVAIMVGNGVGAKNGILFKTAVSLEETGKVQIAVFDKTGTVTSGVPKVTDVIPVGGIRESELLAIAYALEKRSEHPLARAVCEYAENYGGKNDYAMSASSASNPKGNICRAADDISRYADKITDFEALSGNGVKALRDGKRLFGGNGSFIGKMAKIPDELLEKSRELSLCGKTPLFFTREDENKNDALAGIIAVADTIKEDSAQAAAELENMGIHVVMLTGDNEQTARAIGKQAGITHVIAGVLPDGKESVIRSLKEKGKIAMTGDGINDAPALTRADIGIAIGAGTDIAIDAADVVLMKSRLSDVPAAIRLSRRTLKNIRENLFWAFFYNVIGIPIAAGALIPFFKIQLNPMFAAAAMSLSSFCVVTNALRLNLGSIYDASKDRRTRGIAAGNNENKEDFKMTKTMKIEGMMCAHCEARVKKCLEAIDGVAEAAVSHDKGEAAVTLSKDVADEVLRKAVEDQDYQVLSVE